MFINGWTKESTIKHIQDNFKGKAAATVDRFPGDPSSGTIEQCRYLMSDGRKCAVGLFIPDGHAGQGITSGFDELVFEHPELGNLMPLNHASMYKFQTVHDNHLKLAMPLEQQKATLIEFLQNIKE